MERDPKWAIDREYVDAMHEALRLIAFSALSQFGDDLLEWPHWCRRVAAVGLSGDVELLDAAADEIGERLAPGEFEGTAEGDRATNDDTPSARHGTAIGGTDAGRL